MMLVGELAARTGVSARALRHYDAQGLLPVERTANGYRNFPPDAQDRVDTIKGLLACGLNLIDVRAVLPCAGPGEMLQPCDVVVARLHRRLAELDRKAAALEMAKNLLRERLSALDDVP